MMGILCAGQSCRSCKCCNICLDPLNSDDGKSLSRDSFYGVYGAR